MTCYMVSGVTLMKREAGEMAQLEVVAPYALGAESRSPPLKLQKEIALVWQCKPGARGLGWYKVGGKGQRHAGP